MKTVWIYVDTSKQVGDVDHLKVFVDEATADTWLTENDPEKPFSLHQSSNDMARSSSTADLHEHSCCMET